MIKYFVSYTVYRSDGRSFNSNAGIECEGKITNHKDIQELEDVLARRYTDANDVTILYFVEWEGQ